MTVLAESRGVADAASRRVILVGQPRWDLVAIKVGFLVVAGALLVGVGAFVVGRIMWHHSLWWPVWLATAVGLVAVVMTVVVVVRFRRWPPSCRTLRRNTDALAIARSWPNLVKECFSPVTDLRGNTQFPGLRSIEMEDAGIVLSICLPAVKVPGGVEAYLNDGAAELTQRLGVFAVDVQRVQLGDKYRKLLVVYRDATMDVRKVLT